MADIDVPDYEELAEQAKNRFGRRVALVTALYAVLLAITSLGGNNAGKDMMLSQQQASNQWAFYQSKVMREHTYRIEAIKTKALLVERGGAMVPEARKQYVELLALAEKESARYAAEKKEIEVKAKQQEQSRDVSMRKDPYFDFAEAFLQIAIVMSSIAILSSSFVVFCISAASAACGTLLMVNGFTLMFALPFLG
ncbi:DUF4337 family protein [Geobacter pelophilus]|uniref:DUF4337 family protein n=1 Tax=Geoanaerobacter pelophilus TaxID=60036 RepID=A0AAW4L7A0_9BACT|nr:DUF4337 domain-containing protein [Geoanaerobacter pelophilus]MBT0664161.1 DUF4337 family protein [Geoanaerobacter pelophilus]